MSAGRKYRRALTDRPALFVLPEIDDTMPPEVKDAIARRRAANVTGRCPCGAEMVLDGPLRPGEVTLGHMEHEDDCPVPDDRLIALLRRHGWKP